MIRSTFWAVFFIISTSTCWGIDLEIVTKAENLYWSPTREDTVEGRTFRGSEVFWGVQGSLTQELDEGLSFRGGIEFDPILRNRAYAQLDFQLDNLAVSFAPFLGTFNSTDKWFNPGLEALVEYTWPGLLFVRGGFLTTFAPVARPGEYYLSSLTAGVGALMENGILSFNVADKAATFRGADSLTTVDASTRYWIDLEMFVKNFPLRWAFLTGYQLTERSYIKETETSTPLHSVLLGGRLSWDFGLGTLVYLEGSTAFFQQGWDKTVLNVPASTGVFQAVSGIRYHW